MNTHKIAAFVLIAALATPSMALAGGGGAFEGHIREALRLNQSRLPVYSRLSGGKSEAISKRLIFLEQLSIPVAKTVDLQARKFQKKGIPIVAEEFVSMEHVPPFQEKVDNPDPIEKYIPADGEAIGKRLEAALESGGFAGIEKATEAELAAIAGTHTYHCMLRHVLESTLRAAHLAPKHEALAKKLGVESTAKLSTRLLNLQASNISLATELDELAAPVQAMGIPILQQDVPPIPLTSAFYDKASE